MSAKSIRRIVLALFGITTVFIVLWFTVLTSPASRTAGTAIARLHQVLKPGDAESAPVITGSVTFTKADGLPKALLGQSAKFAYRFPDKLWLETEIDGHPYQVARNGRDVWFFAPEKALRVLGSPDVPRFANTPDSVVKSELPPFDLPGTRLQLAALPALIDASFSDTGAEADDPASTEILFSLNRSTRKSLRAPDLDYSLTIDPGSMAPRSIGLRDDASNLDIILSIDDWSVAEAGPSSASGPWVLPASADDHVDHVALAHLRKFIEVVIDNLGSRIEPLPPVTGERRVLAHSGQGRLEEIDGTLVLFLKGTPGEMGRQHGDLLRDKVRSVIDRILYGVGVGSSIDKGSWFFGEIEQAVARLQPHIDDRYLREMDAIADAAGLHHQEVRLANFFPELFHCSGFALHDSATADGTLYHGRVLDYLRGAGLEENAVVMVNKPDFGHAWVNLGYAGFVGSISAMNEKKIAIGEMGGGGEGDWDGKPMAQLMREVMEQADTLDEAIEIMRKGPRTCEYYYVISDGNDNRAVGIAATPDTFELIWSGDSHPKLPSPVEDTVIMSAGDRYTELARRIAAGRGTFTAESARELMTRPVCMKSNIQSVLFAPNTLDFWVANADSDNVASHTRFTHYNLRELLDSQSALTVSKK